MRFPFAPAAVLLASITLGAGAQLPPVPAWRLSREKSISASSEGLDRVTGMVVMPSGTMVVGDYANMKLSVYDTAGRRIARVGGKGSGPGEFRHLNDQSSGFVGDSVWFYDAPGQRVVVYSSNGKHVRTTPIGRTARTGKDSLRGLSPRALLRDGSMIVSASPPFVGEIPPEIYVLAVVSRAGAVMKVLGKTMPGPESVDFWTANGVHHSYAVPFVFSPVRATSSDGAFALIVTAANARANADTVGVTVVRVNGDTLYSVKQVLPRTPLPDSTYDRVRASYLEQGRARGTEAELRKLLIPAIPRWYPAITAAFVTREGRTWLRLHPTACQGAAWPRCIGPTKYLIIGPTGKPEATVAVPGLVALDDAFRESAWGFEEDADGFRNPVRYRIQR